MTDQTTPRAFPSAAIDDRFGGMDLRDWFAGQALIGLASTANRLSNWYTISGTAYAVADAMMAERAKRGKS